VRETLRPHRIYLSGRKKTVIGVPQTMCVVFMVVVTGVI
jgi:hypothetical protein